MASGDARAAAELAALAEEHGWDGFFVWEAVWGIDAWVMLGAAAMTTERIRLGTMLTPLPRAEAVGCGGADVDRGQPEQRAGDAGSRARGAGEERFWLFEDDWSSMDLTAARAAAERRLKAGPPRVD